MAGMKIDKDALAADLKKTFGDGLMGAMDLHISRAVAILADHINAAEKAPATSDPGQKPLIQNFDREQVDLIERAVLAAAGVPGGSYQGPNLIANKIGVARDVVVMIGARLVHSGRLEGSASMGYRRPSSREQPLTGPSGGGIPVAAAFAVEAPPQAAPHPSVLFTREDLEIFAEAGCGTGWLAADAIARETCIHRDIVVARAAYLEQVGALRSNPYNARSYQRVPYRRRDNIEVATTSAPQRVNSSQCGYRRVGSDADWWFCTRDRFHAGACAAHHSLPPSTGSHSWLEGLAREVVGEVMPDGRATEQRLARAGVRLTEVIRQHNHVAGPLFGRFHDYDLRAHVSQTPEDRAMRRARVRALGVEVVL